MHRGHGPKGRIDGWVLGSPERIPTSRTASIAVETVNQEAVDTVGQPGKTGTLWQAMQDHAGWLFVVVLSLRNLLIPIS